MSAESGDDVEPRTVSVQIRDPDLQAALEEAEEGASLSEVVRGSLESDLLEEDNSKTPEGKVTAQAKRGYRAMEQYVSDGEFIEVDTAESVVANYCNVPSDSVRHTIFQPLREAGWIGVTQRIEHVMIQLKGRGDS